MKQNTFSLLEAELQSEKCLADFNEMKTLTNLNVEESAKLDEFFKYKIDSLLESGKDIIIDDDESELLRLLPHIWIEYRMEWTRYNAQMQYQTVLLGQAKPLLAARGAILSYIMGIVEKYLNIEELYWCTKLAADPMDLLRSRTKLAQRMIEMAHSSGKAGQDIVENLVQLRDTLSVEIKSAAGVVGLEKVLRSVEELLSESTALRVSDLNESLEMVLSKSLPDCPIPIVLSRLEVDSEILLPSITIAGINRLFSDWLQVLKEKSIESSIEERRSAGKSDHLSVTWKMKELPGGRIRIELENDGKGLVTLEEIVDIPSDWSIQQEAIPGKGSKILIEFKGTQLADMIIFSISNQSDEFKFALLASEVIEILSEEQLKNYKEGPMAYARIGEGDHIYPLVDLSELLFGVVTPASRSIFVRVACGDNEYLVVKVGKVDLMVRDSMKNGPSTLYFIQGYFVLNGSVISVIDINKLKEVIDGKHEIAIAS